MENMHRKINLGFTTEQFEPGVHICQIFNEEEERHDALIHFVVSGLKEGESTACFTEKESESTLKSFLKENGILYQEALNSGKFTLSKTAEVYFEGGSFDPERMLSLLKDFYLQSKDRNFAGARVIGEMVPEVDRIPGGSRLMEYECKVSMLLRDFPVTAVCQYDARSFDGSTIMDILKVHPYMIVRKNIVRNPYYVQPEEFMNSLP